jgi:prepilin-type processing-associated H-X9-DG protein
MFKLLGADKKEYGPVSADQIRAWMAQGRANARTQLQAAGSKGWKPLAEFPEFAAALRPAKGANVPKLPATGTQPTTAPAKRCGLAVMVSAGLLVFVLILAAMLLPALVKAKQKEGAVHCMNNVKQLNLGLIMYADNNKDRLPNGAAWCDSLRPYLGGTTNAFVCPQGAPNQRCHYALNAQLAGRSVKELQVPAQTVLVFEIDGGWNVSGGWELFPAQGRHSGAYAVGFADGHAEMVRPDRLEKLRWEP